MKIRPRNLEEGWYPSTEKDVRDMVEGWERSLNEDTDRNAGAGIAPHAGWFFSGALAWNTIRRAQEDTETVVVAGGHRPEGTRALYAEEEAFETPSGTMSADAELLRAVRGRLEMDADRWADNTVEVLVPLVKFRFPDARLLWIRVPNDERARSVGEAVARSAEEIHRKVFFLASTDLTHYGSNYNFSPKGSGEAAHAWVRDVNDRGIIESFLAMDIPAIVRKGNEERAACSPGPVAAAIGFARAVGCTRPRLCGYYTSRDVYPAESFVGYCSVTYS